MVEPLGNSVQVPYTPCYHCEGEVRGGSVQTHTHTHTLHDQTDLEEFFEAFLASLRAALVIVRKEPAAERVLDCLCVCFAPSCQG